MTNNRPPRVRARTWTWYHPDGSKQPGIAIFTRGTIQAHLTTTQARALADRLHDLADELETSNPAPEPTP